MRSSFLSSCLFLVFSLTVFASDSSADYMIHPGEVKLVEFPLKDKEKEGKLICNELETPYFVEEGKVRALVSQDYFSKKGSFKCSYKDNIVANFSVEDKEYPQEVLLVPDKKIFLSKKSLKRVEKEQAFLKDLYTNGSKEKIFDGAFVLPIDSLTTSEYGKRRVFNGKKKGQHLGTDFRAKDGSSFWATNKGKVLFAGELFYTGNTLIIDHGLGIFSVYGHLSKILVKEGDIIEKKQILGETGHTGRVSGPHLHWGIKIQSHWINGKSLIDCPL